MIYSRPIGYDYCGHCGASVNKKSMADHAKRQHPGCYNENDYVYYLKDGQKPKPGHECAKNWELVATGVEKHYENQNSFHESCKKAMSTRNRVNKALKNSIASGSANQVNSGHQTENYQSVELTFETSQDKQVALIQNNNQADLLQVAIDEQENPIAFTVLQADSFSRQMLNNTYNVREAVMKAFALQQQKQETSKAALTDFLITQFKSSLSDISIDVVSRLNTMNNEHDLETAFYQQRTKELKQEMGKRQTDIEEEKEKADHLFYDLQFKSVKTVKEYILEIANPKEIPEPELDDLVKVAEALSSFYFEFKDFAPNEQQKAIALVAVYFYIKKETRQLWTIPAGFGKTRVALALCFYLNHIKKSKLKKIIFIFANQKMKDREALLYTRVSSGLLGCQVQRIIVEEFDANYLKNDTVIIMDEADYGLLDKRMKIPFGAGFFIGLTATAFRTTRGAESHGAEEIYLKKKGFSMHDSKMLRMFDQSLIKMELQEFLLNNDMLQIQQLKMVYGEAGIEKEVETHLGQNSYLLNQKDTSVLSKLETIAGLQVLVVTDDDLMRGFDYRCKQGISLFIAKSFPHTRAFEQGIGRVGRQFDPYKLFISPDVEAVDSQKQLTYMAELCQIN